MGDLYLLGFSIIGEFKGYKSGHALNNALVHQLLAQPESWEFVTFANKEEMPTAYTYGLQSF